MPAGKRFKIACVGAGNVGASAAQYCAEMELGDVILTDVVEGMPQGKALDLTQAGPIRGYSTMLTGTNDYKDIEGADVCIVTAGLPRPLPFDRSLMSGAEPCGHEALQCRLAIDGEIAVIPDLEYLQTQLEQQIAVAA